MARALYRRPRVLFLDEGTSHLDVETERQINATLRRLEITRVSIAHRPETIRAGDRVLMIGDRDLRIKVWNDRATDLWGLRADETHLAHFLGLDIGLPVADLRGPVREVMNGSQDRAQLILPATSRRGRAVECKVSVTPLRGVDQSPAGVILFMEEATTEKPV